MVKILHLHHIFMYILLLIYTSANSSFKAAIVVSKLALSNTLNILASGAIFLFKPARTFPGPISTKISTPSFAIC